MYFLNYHVVFGSDINASDNGFAREPTIRTMRRGFARVLDHQTIIDILTNADEMHDDAVRERERRKASAQDRHALGARLRLPNRPPHALPCGGHLVVPLILFDHATACEGRSRSRWPSPRCRRDR